MDIRARLYPHPVLTSYSDDYIDSEFSFNVNIHYFTGFKQHKIVDLPACIVSSGSFRHFLAS